MGKGVVKLGEGNWAVKDGNLLAAKETNGRFKNAEFTVDRGSDATYVGRDGLIKRFSSGLANKVANGDFEELGDNGVDYPSDVSSTSNFILDSSTNLYTYDDSSGSTGQMNFTNAIATEVGLTYKIVIDITISSGNANVAFKSGNSQTILFNFTDLSNGVNTFYSTVTGVDGDLSRLFVSNGSTDNDFTLNSISVQQVDPNDRWTLPSGWSISNNQLVGNDPSGFATVANVFYANKSYRLDVDVAERDSGSFSIISNSTDSNSNATPAIDSAGIHTFYFHIGTIDLETLYVTFGGDFVGKINSITVRDIEDFDDRPRIDFTDNTDGHLLLEPQSTNLVTYSNQISSSTYSVNSGTGSSTTITDNYGTSPDGTQNAARLVATSATGTSEYALRGFTYNISSAEDFTQSVYLKSNTGSSQSIIFYGRNTGTRTPITVTNEWQRFEITGESNTTNYFIYLGLRPEDGTDSSCDVLVYGLQVEQLGYSTSLIPTNGSTVTRDGETCTGAGEAADFNSEEGVLYAEIAALANDGNWREISLNDGSTNNAVEIRYKSTDNQFQFVVRDGGTVVVSPTRPLTNPLEFIKVAFSYKTDDFKMYINGADVATDTDGTMPSGLNNLSFDWGGTNPFYGKCKAIRVYKEALSDTDLQNLTS